VIYFQLSWIERAGLGVSFGCQAMMLAVAFIVGVVPAQVWGGRWRLSHPPPSIVES